MLTTMTRLCNWVAAIMVMLTVAYLYLAFADLLNLWVVGGLLIAGTTFGFSHCKTVATQRASENNG